MEPMSSAEARGQLPAASRDALLHLAREAIRFHIEHDASMPVDEADFPPELRTHRATFVTLHLAGEFVGCIGTIQPRESIVASVARNARAAAFEDPRSPGVRPRDVDRLEVHISLLSPLEPVHFSSEADLISQLRPGVDGLVLEERFHRGTFLPSVWESLPEPETFLNHLKMKAGLPSDYWSPGISAYRYTVDSIAETL
jgi:uncharacterized protein